MKIPKEVGQLFKDLSDSLPKDVVAFEKLKCELTIGKRVYWYFEEDVEFDKETGFTSRERKPYSGIAIPVNGVSYSGGDIETDDCVIVQDQYPCEKCYPEIQWIALGRLLDAPGLVEIFGD